MKVSTLSFVLLIFLSSIATSIAFFARPEQLDDQSFYFALCWLNALVIANWAVGAFFFPVSKSGGDQRTRFGILPSLHVVTLAYSIASIGMLVHFWRIYDFQFLPNIHWILQLGALGLYGGFVILALIASKTAEIGPSEFPDRQELLAKINRIRMFLMERSFENADLMETMRGLDNAVRYSIPHPSVLKEKDSYQKLCVELESLSTNLPLDIDYKEEFRRLTLVAKTCR